MKPYGFLTRDDWDGNPKLFGWFFCRLWQPDNAPPKWWNIPSNEKKLTFWIVVGATDWVSLSPLWVRDNIIRCCHQTSTGSWYWPLQLFNNSLLHPSLQRLRLNSSLFLFVQIILVSMPHFLSLLSRGSCATCWSGGLDAVSFSSSLLIPHSILLLHLNKSFNPLLSVCVSRTFHTKQSQLTLRCFWDACVLMRCCSTSVCFLWITTGGQECLPFLAPVSTTTMSCCAPDVFLL